MLRIQIDANAATRVRIIEGGPLRARVITTGPGWPIVVVEDRRDDGEPIEAAHTGEPVEAAQGGAAATWLRNAAATLRDRLHL